ncbi:MAG: cytochrome c [Bdellovibrionales bacterium]|nr:cytochrome c [Bdellovibrionales bacterium]
MNRRLALFTSALLIASSAAAFSEPAQAEDSIKTTTEKQGQNLFKENCSSCHGLDARGDGPMAGALKTTPADLTKIAERREGNFPAGEIAKIIDGRTLVASHGSREMPVWGHALGEELGGGELSDELVRGKLFLLIDYLRSIQR